MLRVEHVGWQFATGARLLEDVHFAAARGEWTAVIGPNGAGKTSLLRLLVGLRAPSAGRITLDGRALESYDALARARRIAYVPQASGSAWDVSVRELVALGRLMHAGCAAQSEDAEAIDEALEVCDLTALAGRGWRGLSGGERARTVLARALCARTPWLVADEPFAALDVRHQWQLADAMQGLRARGVGGVLAMHDVALAARCCTKFLLLADGRQLAHAPLAEIAARGLFRRAFGMELKAVRHGGAEIFVPLWPKRRIAQRAQKR